MTETETLIHRIHTVAKALNRAPSTLSARVLGGGQVLYDLECGKTITLSKYERANAMLSEIEAEMKLAATTSPEARPSIANANP